MGKSQGAAWPGAEGELPDASTREALSWGGLETPRRGCGRVEQGHKGPVCRGRTSQGAEQHGGCQVTPT